MSASRHHLPSTQRRVALALVIGALTAALVAAPALAGKKPGGGGVTTPGDFRVVGTTPYSVTFA